MSELNYSIIMPYYNRDCLNITLLSFTILYPQRNDYEVVIVEDQKNINNIEYHNKLLEIIDRYNKIINIKLVANDLNTYNPARAFNLGVSNASGKYLILTNPECAHIGNILDYADRYMTESIYTVFGCLLVDCANTNETKYDKVIFHSRDFWYQHSLHRNAQYHFCSCILRDLYLKIGGFDEGYSKTGGIGYEDNDFVLTVKRNNIPIKSIDDPYVYHISHEIGYQNRDLLEINRLYYKKKWNL